MTKGRKLPKLPRSDKYTFWNDFMGAGATQDTQLPPIDGSAREGAVILYSGGTTGTHQGHPALQPQLQRPGAADRGHERLYRPARHEDALGDAHLPRFGLASASTTALVVGATCILVPQFTISTYAKLLKKKKPNLIPGVPTLFEALCALTSWKTPT